MDMITEPALFRLLQLSSPALPVGSYAYSHGLEAAVDLGWLSDAQGVQKWIETQLDAGLSRLDLPVAMRLYNAMEADIASFDYWNSWLLASRETGELVDAELALGRAIVRVLDGDPAWPGDTRATFVGGFILAARHWAISLNSALHGYVWSWMENLVTASTKLLPIGQKAAQSMLTALQEPAAKAIERASRLRDDHLGASLPGVALASCHHETQYSRLFRS